MNPVQEFPALARLSINKSTAASVSKISDATNLSHQVVLKQIVCFPRFSGDGISQ